MTPHEKAVKFQAEADARIAANPDMADADRKHLLMRVELHHRYAARIARNRHESGWNRLLIRVGLRRAPAVWSSQPRVVRDGQRFS